MQSPFGKKVRTLAIGALATAALSIPAVSTLTVTSHQAGRGYVKPSSHRLAVGIIRPLSLRLT